jgi:methylenetetrahydrofolate reductase (NADPH)
VAGALGAARFEVLPFARAEEEAARLPEPTWLTVTSSPRHDPERTIEFAARLAALGHAVTPHLAARAVRDRDHLDRLLGSVSEAGIDDLFVIGGDNGEPAGEFSAAADLLPLIRENPHGVLTIGIAAYPEGHPLIGSDALARVLEQKAPFADYMTTQMCFDAEVLLGWLRTTRAEGLTLPVHIGMPGIVDRRRLLEVSIRIGVGPSVAYVRKQRGLFGLLRRPASTVEKLYDALAPGVDDATLGVDGFHYYTLNQLLDTWEWERSKHSAAVAAAEGRRR